MYPDFDQLTRFELTYGQLFSGEIRYRNLRWFLNDVEIGWGDLRDEDIGRIAKKLRDEDEFLGYSTQVTLPSGREEVLMLRILPEFIQLREDIVRANG